MSVPDAPTFTSSPVVVDSTTITVAFTLGSNGGSALTAIQYARSTDNYATWTSLPGLITPLEDNTTATITGLTPSAYGSYKLRSINANGNSPVDIAQAAYILNSGAYYTKVLFSSDNQYALAVKFNDGSVDEAAVSSNGGLTWTTITPPGGNACTDIAMSLDGGYMYYTSSVGVYLSTNYGVAFTLLSGSPTSVGAIACNSTGERVYCSSTSSPDYLYASDSYGTTFALTAGLLGFPAASIKCNASGEYVYVLPVASPTNTSVYVSNNYAVSFTSSDAGVGSITGVACDQTGQRVFISTANGIKYSLKYGIDTIGFPITFLQTSSTSECSTIACDSLGNRLIIMRSDGTTDVSYDAGTSWNQMNIIGQDYTSNKRGASISPDGTRFVSSSGQLGTYIKVDLTPYNMPNWSVLDTVRYFNGAISNDNQHIVAVHWNPFSNSVVDYSSDGGATWNSAADFGNVNQVVSSLSGQIVLAIADAVPPHISTDYGATFTATSLSAYYGDYPQFYAVMNASGTSMMTVDSYGGYIYVSTDSGANWSNTYQFTDGFTYLACSSLTMDRIYAVTYPPGGVGTIYVSTNMGSSWTSLGENPSTSNLNAMACDWSGQNVVFSAGSNGVYRSTNGGVSWAQTSAPTGGNMNYIASNGTGNRIIVYNESNNNYTAYAVYVSLDAGATWSTLATPSAYQYQIQGIMISPDGSQSITGSSDIFTYFQTLGAPDLPLLPGPPSFTSAITVVDNTTVSFDFAVGYAGASALTAIQYARDTDNYATWTTITGLTTPLEDATSATISGLTPPSTGSYKIRSVNSAGPSVPSDAAAAYQVIAGEYYPKVLFSSNNQYAIARKFNDGGLDEAAVSSDGGVTWTAITPPTGGCNDVAMSLDGTIMYYTAYDSGTYKSTDYGVTFLPLSAAPLYPTTIVCNSTGQRVFLQSDDDYYIYVSNDAGVTFTQGANLGFFVASMACNASGDHIYLIQGSDVYLSTDYGATFAMTTSNYYTISSIACDQTGKLVFVSVIGGGGVSVSLDYGTTFDDTTYYSDNSDDVSSVVCDSLGNRLTSLTPEGIIRVSYNAGTTWVELPPIPGQSLTFTSGGVSISPDGTRYVSSLGAPGTFMKVEGTPDAVSVWRVINNVYYFNGSISTDNQNIVARKFDYGNTGLSTVVYSSDAGVTWNDTPDFGDVHRVVASASGETVLAIMNDGTLPQVSTDYGATFTITTMVPVGTTPNRLAVIDSTGASMMAIADDGHVYVSTDSGVIWTNPYQFTDGTNFRAICASQTMDQVYVLFFSNTDQLWYIYGSTDMGVTWASVSVSPVPSPSDTFDIACDWSGQKLVLAGGDSGVYRSTNSGVTWTQLQLPVINSAYILSPRKIVSNSTGNRIAFVDPWNWYMSIVSIDAGATWSPVYTPDAWYQEPQGDIISPDGSFIMSASGRSTYVQTLGAADLPSTATVPDAPTFTSSPTIVSNTSISVVFSLGSNGGSDLTDLEYARDTDSYATWTSLGLSLPLEGQTTATITGLTGPSTGSYKLRSVNAVGNSDPSTEGIAQPIAPAAPSFTSTPTAVNTTSINIAFSLGFNGGLALMDLEYARDTDSYATWTSVGLSLPLEGQTTATITGLTPPVTGNYKLRSVNDVGNSVASAAELVSGTIPCFLEGSKILCLVDGVEKYVAVETIRPGTLVKTSRDGFQPVKLIGSRPVVNVGGDIRDKNSLYLCTKANYPELTEDLIITGCHAILVDHITDVHRQGIINTLERVFVTDKKYRLPACVDERASVHQATGDFTVWHFALEHADIKMNYGVYAHGLLVESSPIWHMNTKNYTLVQ